MDDIAELKKWVKSNPERLQQKKEDKMRRLNRKLVEPKHQIDNSFFFEQKELIEERQTSAFSDLKRKMTEQAKTMQEPVKKKKWYEYEEDDEPKEKVEPERIEVLAPSEVRSKQFRERLDIEAIKLFGKSAEQLDKNPTVVLEVQTVLNYVFKLPRMDPFALLRTKLGLMKKRQFGIRVLTSLKVFFSLRSFSYRKRSVDVIMSSLSARIFVRYFFEHEISKKILFEIFHLFKFLYLKIYKIQQF